MHIAGANPIFQSGLMLGAPITNSSLDLEGLIPGRFIIRPGRADPGPLYCRGRHGRGRHGRRTYL